MTAGHQRESVPGALTVEPDSDAVFRAAIRAGVLSEKPGNGNWAGHYLYMFHDGAGAAWFKHRDTRRYVTMATCRTSCPARGAA